MLKIYQNDISSIEFTSKFTKGLVSLVDLSFYNTTNECFQSVNSENRDALMSGEVTCGKGLHPLEYFKGAPQVYIDKYGSNVVVNCEGPGCDKGGRAIREGYNCPTCGFDLCEDCYEH